MPNNYYNQFFTRNQFLDAQKRMSVTVKYYYIVILLFISCRLIYRKLFFEKGKTFYLQMLLAMLK